MKRRFASNPPQSITGGQEAPDNGDDTMTSTDEIGSGLALFFQDYLPDVAGFRPSFTTSLSSMPDPAPEFVNGLEGSMGTFQSKERRLTYREWREEQKRYLMDFLQHRMARTNHGMEDSEEEPVISDYDVDESIHGGDMTQTQPQTQPIFETQEDWINDKDNRASNNGDEIASGPPQKRRKRTQMRIPHIKEAVHDVSKLEYLDMYTQSLHLPLCQVVKVWNLRSTIRCKSRPFLDSPRLCFTYSHSSVPMPRVDFGNMEEDGPVASAYRSVLSMEVEQMKLPESDGLKGIAPSSDAPKRQKRIKIFFYNSYAERIAQWIEKQQKKKRHSFILSLANLPSTCIFPRAHADTFCWIDLHHMVEYCICIGDTSGAKYVGDDIFIRFDDLKLQLNMADKSLLDSDKTVDELILSRKTSATNSRLSSSEESGRSSDMTAPVIPSLKETWTMFTSQTCSNGAPKVHQQQRQESQQHRGDGDQQSRVEVPITETPGENTGGQVASAPMTDAGNAVRNTITHNTEYLPLRDLRDMLILDDIPSLRNNEETVKKEKFLNIYGVVICFTSPRQTTRGDWSMSALLMDESCEEPVSLNMFESDPGLLPKIGYMGDVLRAHRVKLQKWDGKPQMVGSKFKSSYVVVRQKWEEWFCSPTARKSYSFDGSDEERSRKLWQWGQDMISRSPTINKQHSFTLAELTVMSSQDEIVVKDRDITVMVTGIFEFPEVQSGATPHGMLRAWDGTGFPPSDPFLATSLQTQQATRRGEPPPEALEHIVQIVQRLNTRDEKLEIPLSFCGRVANVVVWEKEHWNLIKEYVPVGSFVRIRNVDIRCWHGTLFRSLVVHSKTWLTPLPVNNYEVCVLLRAHNERVLRGEYNPESGLLPATSRAVSTGSKNVSGTMEDPHPAVNNLDHSKTMTLNEFVDKEHVGSFIGIVSVKLVPDHVDTLQLEKELDNSSRFRSPVLLKVEDKTASIIALASKMVCQRLGKLSTTRTMERLWEDVTSPSKEVEASLRSVDWECQRFFVLTDIPNIESNEYTRCNSMSEAELEIII